MTLSEDELLRQILMLLPISPDDKMDWLKRREIKRGPYQDSRAFRKRRRNWMPIINVCVKELKTWIANGGIEKAEKNYYGGQPKGLAAIDIVRDTLRKHLPRNKVMYSDLASEPPTIFRTKTYIHGYRVPDEVVAFGSWEK